MCSRAANSACSSGVWVLMPRSSAPISVKSDARSRNRHDSAVQPYAPGMSIQPAGSGSPGTPVAGYRKATVTPADATTSSSSPVVAGSWTRGTIVPTLMWSYAPSSISCFDDVMPRPPRAAPTRSVSTFLKLRADRAGGLSVPPSSGSGPWVAAAGFGAALVAPAALSILAVTFPEAQERNRALGIFGAVGGTSASVGVIASGLLTDGPGWRWVFFINIPVGVLLIGLVAVFLAVDRPERRTGRLDVAGATAVTGGLLLLVYALNRGADYGWTSGTTLMLFAAAALLLAAFVRIEVRSPAPLVPAVALRNRTLVAANLSAFFTFSAFFSFIFLGSLLTQQVLGYSPTKTGLSWLTTSATA